jgi:hypothetical protein
MIPTIAAFEAEILRSVDRAVVAAVLRGRLALARVA